MSTIQGGKSSHRQQQPARCERSARPGEYKAPKQFREHLPQLQKTKLTLNVTMSLLIHVIVLFATIAGYGSIRHAPIWVWLPNNAICWLVISVCMRSLEVLVHEGSHYNWTRHKPMNDWLTNLLAALPMMSLVHLFRATHNAHHTKVKRSELDDPKRLRYERLGIGQLQRNSLWQFILQASPKYGQYWLSWWQNVGAKPVVLMLFLIWHLFVYVAPGAIWLGADSIFVWCGYWLAPMMITLTFIRFVGEADEHAFDDDDGLLTNTVSNYHVIASLLFHPLNDGYHLLHHLYPCIPWHNLARAHTLLMHYDPKVYGQLHLRRDRVAEHPHTTKRP